MMFRILPSLLLVFFAAVARPALADAMLADFDYPHPVATYSFAAQGQNLTMAYMDVRPAKPNGKTAVLLHGKNFCGATWETVIAPLADAGFRVIVPDQSASANLQSRATITSPSTSCAEHARPPHIAGHRKPIFIGHSMGGMLATRYVLSFPHQVGALVLVNPIGLEDWRAKGVPDRSINDLFEAEKKTDAAKIKAYQLKAQAV